MGTIQHEAVLTGREQEQQKEYRTEVRTRESSCSRRERLAGSTWDRQRVGRGSGSESDEIDRIPITEGLGCQ